MSNCKELWIARRKHQHLQPAGKDHKLGKRDGVPQKEQERERDRWTERVKTGGRILCFMKKKVKSPINIENVETTGQMCCHLS